MENALRCQAIYSIKFQRLFPFFLSIFSRPSQKDNKKLQKKKLPILLLLVFGREFKYIFFQIVFDISVKSFIHILTDLLKKSKQKNPFHFIKHVAHTQKRIKIIFKIFLVLRKPSVNKKKGKAEKILCAELFDFKSHQIIDCLFVLSEALWNRLVKRDF